jgi:hypothetical protein
MNKTEKNVFTDAMAFYHQDGLPSTWQQAMRFAGKKGRLAIMPDIVAARLEKNLGEMPWETYFTTLTAEYCGFSKQGKRILIIAHGIGPMSTLEGIQKAYSWEYKDKNRRKQGGRISQQEFWDLETGKFGEVSIIDFEEYCKRYQYPFLQVLKASQALTDPVLKARLGIQAEQYILAHAEHARRWHREQAGFDPENRYQLPKDTHQRYLDRRREQHKKDGAENSDPYIIQLRDASNCCYTFGPSHGHREIERGYAIAHLISTGRLCHLCHEGKESLTLDVGCHEWWNGVRFIGIRAGSSIKIGLHKGPDAYRLLRKHWRDLLMPVTEPGDIGFRALVKIDRQWFTQYPKQGARMDTWEPEYLVISLERVGKPVLFRTTVGGYHGFFKFATNEVQAIAPPDVNAYFFVSEPQIEWNDNNPTHHTAMVQFYQIKANTSKRLIRSDQLARNYERMMELMKKEVV